MNAELTRLANGKYGMPIARELGHLPVTDQHGNQHPRNIWDIWTDKQLVEIGHARIIESTIPAGKRSTGFADTFTANKINRAHTLEDIPPPPPPTIISLEDFEERFTTAEWCAATDFIYEMDIATGKPKNRALLQELSRSYARNNVNLLDSKTDAFMTKLVTGGIVTTQRKTEILTP
jgi:hypothetical protein